MNNVLFVALLNESIKLGVCVNPVTKVGIIVLLERKSRRGEEII